jgi:hypothetical protein
MPEPGRFTGFMNGKRESQEGAGAPGAFAFFTGGAAFDSLLAEGATRAGFAGAGLESLGFALAFAIGRERRFTELGAGIAGARSSGSTGPDLPSHGMGDGSSSPVDARSEWVPCT